MMRLVIVIYAAEIHLDASEKQKKIILYTMEINAFNARKMTRSGM